MSDIEFYRFEELGKGLPFAIVPHLELTSRIEQLMTPSLRNFHVIFWFKKGRGKYYIDFVEYNYQPNTIILLSKDQLHYLGQLPKNAEIMSIVFTEDFLYRNDNDLFHLFNFNISCHIEGQQIIKLRRENADLLNNLTSLMEMVYQNWSGKEQNVAFYHYLCNFLVYCEHIQKSVVINMKIDENTKLIIEFTHLLEKSYKTEIGVNFYANQLAISQKTLTNITNARYKLSPKALINQRRILEMKRLLKGSSKAVKEIAYDFDFTEATNMIKYFKKYTNLTPLEFKES